jgi:hypothetical protein
MYTRDIVAETAGTGRENSRGACKAFLSIGPQGTIWHRSYAQTPGKGSRATPSSR